MKIAGILRSFSAAAAIVSATTFAFAQTGGAPSSHDHAAMAKSSVPQEARRITIEEVQKHMAAKDKMIIVDARGAFTGAMIKDAVHVPVADAEKWAQNIDKNALIVAYCACGSEGTSLAFVTKLQSLGFTNAFALKGGITGWQTAGLPTQQMVAEAAKP